MVRYISDYGLGAREERDDEWRTEALANFPFEIVETRGEEALVEWQELKTAGRGVPVVVGDLDGVLEPFSPGYPETLKPVQETLAAASAIRFPQGLAQMRHDRNVAAWEMLRKMGDSVDLDDEAFQVREPPLGEWPPSPSISGLVRRIRKANASAFAGGPYRPRADRRSHHRSGPSALG